MVVSEVGSELTKEEDMSDEEAESINNSSRISRGSGTFLMANRGAATSHTMDDALDKLKGDEGSTGMAPSTSTPPLGGVTPSCGAQSGDPKPSGGVMPLGGVALAGMRVVFSLAFLQVCSQLVPTTTSSELVELFLYRDYGITSATHIDTFCYNYPRRVASG